MADSEQIEKAWSLDYCYWANTAGIRLQSNDVFSLTGHEYLRGVMESKARVKVAMKATGMGFSESLGILPSIWGMIYGRYKQGVLYLFPTDKDVGEYSKSRIDTLALNNKAVIGKYLKPGRKGTDTTHLKQFNNSFLYLRGATLKPEDEDAGGTKSSQVSGIQVDRVVFDELRLMNQEVIEKALMRMGHSEVKEEVYIANPGGEDEDIDIMFQKSNQQYYARKCDCGHWTIPELEFPSCVKVYSNWQERQRAGLSRGYIACRKCGSPVQTFNGWDTVEWVKQRKESEIDGWTISHLSSSFHDPADVLEHFENPPNDNLGDVIRLEIGRAYSSREDKLQKHTVLANCGNDYMPEHFSGPCAMGVDVGLVKHVVIGIKTAPERYEILKVAQVKSFRDIHDLAGRYGVKSEVVDIRPYEDEARNYQRLQKASSSKVFLCQYTESPLDEADFNDNTGVVKVHRTGIFDKSHRLIVNGNIRLPRQCPDIEEFARQCCNCAKHKEEDKRSGKIVYRYAKTGTGDEHYRNALNYFLLASSGHRVRTVNPANKVKRSEFADNEYQRV